MNVLLIKLSSMGDIIHTLPALTDAMHAYPGIKFTWLVDAGFAEIPGWHPAVQQVIPIELRKRNKAQILAAVKQLRATKFDMILDAQGLLKSAILARLARGKLRIGYDRDSCREPAASVLYNRKVHIQKDMHAIDRLRKLFADGLGYLQTHTHADYGVNWNNKIPAAAQQLPYLVFLHGTTWDTKHWPDKYWLELANIAAKHDYNVQVTWATAEQKERAARLQAYAKNVTMLPHLTINQAASVLQNAHGVVAVDTGFAHLAAALEKPMVAIYGATDVKKAGTVSNQSINLVSRFKCAPCSQRTCTYVGERELNPPCMQEHTPHTVWQNLAALLRV